MSNMTSLVGSQLKTKHAVVDTTQVLQDKKVVALYFSAHWCPPCRSFTPMFADIYNKSADRDKFEVIFVSMDRDEKQFKTYYNESHPWVAMPYDNEEQRQKLSMQYHVSGIPNVTVLRCSDGKVIDKDGRMTIMSKKGDAIKQWLQQAEAN